VKLSRVKHTLARARHQIEERAGKSAAGGFASYVFTTWLDHVIYLTPMEKAGVYAVAAAVFSVAASLVSLPFGPKGSPSLVQDGAEASK
jgi:hypothetical protein